MLTSKCGPTTPLEHAPKVWAIPSSLATTLGITIVFFSSPYLDVSVQEVGSLSSTVSSIRWVVPFGNAGIYRLCAAPPALSQLTTSFVASQTQGIHHVPLFALKIFKFLNSVILLSLRFLLGLLPILIFQYVKELKYEVQSAMYEVHNTKTHTID
jgi:hypothetical protein